MKTPRTDAAKFRIGDSNHFAVHVMHVEQLETELQEMTALAERLADTLKDCKNRAMDKSIETHPDEHAKGCIDDIWEWAEEALAAYEKSKKVIS